MTADLCLGTAQFGLSYGVTNSSGKLTTHQAKDILDLAGKSGFRWIDTAQVYGNAVAVLGQSLERSHKFSIISKIKLSELATSFNKNDIDSWEHEFISQCVPQCEKSIDALLLHNPSVLYKKGSELLVSWLYSLKERGYVKRLGLSIYSSSDLAAAPIDLLDIVQLPLSLYDQRLLHDGTISWLCSKGCVVHARSIFLQGLLLTPVSNWPSWVNTDVRTHHALLELYCQKNSFSLLEMSLGFIRSLSCLEAAVVGVTSVHELSELAECWQLQQTHMCTNKDQWKSWAIENSSFLDPRHWPSP